MFGVFGGVPGFDARVPVEQRRGAKMATPQGDVTVPPGIFGGPRRRGGGPVGLPGPISGYGGGTWNTDGSPATPDARGNMRPMPGATAAPVLEAQEEAPNHWSVEGFERMGRSMAAPQAQQRGGDPAGGPLGHSMRQPFDYDAALQSLMGQKQKNGTLRMIAAVLGDTLTGGRAGATRNLIQQRNAQKERTQEAVKTLLGWKHDDWSRQNEADLRAANPFTVGRDRVAYDPATGQASVLYDGAEDFEEYASELGLEPGSPEYFRAVEDYVLKGNGPSAHERDIELDDHRTGNDRSLEGTRFDNRTALEVLRQRHRGALENVRQGNRLEVRRTPSAGRSGGSAKPTATDAKGNKVEWNGKAWVPVQ